jgi:oligopeptide/dipeptide ABC transporter ATP-binding protein
MTLLKVAQLKKYFTSPRSLFHGARPAVRAIEEVSFSIEKGESFALVGESGCGKSTVARCIVGLLRPDGGEVQINGNNLEEMRRRAPRDAYRAVQMVFQDPYSSLNPRKSIGDAIAEPLIVDNMLSRSQIRTKVASLLEEVGLDAEAALRYPHEFSGGQRQRIGIARALALEPALLIADEPVSALDVSIQSQILLLLKSLQRNRNLSILFITHDLGVVRNFCDRMGVMYLGRIVERGGVDEVLDHPLHPYSAALRDAALAPDVKTSRNLVQLEGEMPSAVNPPTGCHFHPRCPVVLDQCSRVDPPWIAQSATRGARCHLLAASDGGQTPCGV